MKRILVFGQLFCLGFVMNSNDAEAKKTELPTMPCYSSYTPGTGLMFIHCPDCRQKRALQVSDPSTCN